MRTQLVVIVMSSVVGCVSVPPTEMTTGRNFNEKLVDKIEKGKTTTAEVKTLFGEPFMKNVMSANEEKWLYFYTRSTATAQGSVFTPITVRSEGRNKTLDVLFKDGVVTNFTYSNAPQATTYGPGAQRPPPPPSNIPEGPNGVSH